MIRRKQFDRIVGFTMMELLVALTIMLVIISAVGQLFGFFSRSIQIANANVEILSNMRSFQQRLTTDLQGLDRSGFLVIRSRMNPNNQRVDQLSFISRGQFSLRTGYRNAGNPLIDPSLLSPVRASAALVWYGHLVFEQYPTIGANFTATNDTILTTTTPGSFYLGLNPQDYTLGRRAFLLLPNDNVTYPWIPYFTDLKLSSSVTATVPQTNGSTAAALCSSRADAAFLVPEELMASVMATVGTSTGTNRGTIRIPEAFDYTYRSTTLASPIKSELINSLLRMHPVLLPHTTSFAVEWTDGQIDPGTKAILWYGRNKSGPYTAAAAASGLPTCEFPTGGTIGPADIYYDDYWAVFSFDSKNYWPKALRFTLAVTDANDRLQGGRTFSFIVMLPH